MLAGAAPASADIKMGSLYPFSGPLALLGDESARGLEIAVEEINARVAYRAKKSFWCEATRLITIRRSVKRVA
ncbi:unnamed protein product [Brucella canis str. Oliveri]|nr:unnamed protein product [Brucella canis str. Oliveri]